MHASTGTTVLPLCSLGLQSFTAFGSLPQCLQGLTLVSISPVSS